jgi:chorismate mutase
VVVAVRGAIRVRADDKEAIHTAAVRLAAEVVARNQIEIDRIVSIICSLTPDLTAANPATGLRLERFGEVPLFCVQEAAVEGQMTRVLRLLVTYDRQQGGPPQPVYLDGAQRLRPDLERPSGT